MAKKLTTYSFSLPDDSPLRRKVTVSFPEKSRINPDAIKDSSIQELVKKHLSTGTPFNINPGNYIDSVDIPLDMTERYALLKQGHDAYSTLPDDVKTIFKSPGEFLDAFKTSSGIKRLIQSGFLIQKPKQTVQDTTVSKPNGGTAEGGGSKTPPA